MTHIFLDSEFSFGIFMQDHFLFEKPVSPILLAAGMTRDWPDARGVWHNEQKNCLLWINEEDHIRVISMETGGNMFAAFKRFCYCLKKVTSVTIVKIPKQSELYS